MARIAVIGAGGTTGVPPVFGLLPHDVQAVGGLDRVAPDLDVDLWVVDARHDLPGGRETCLLLRAQEVPRPVLLIVPAEALPVVGRDWGMDDFVLDGAPAGEIAARLRLLLSANDQVSRIVCGPVVIDEDAYTATVDGTPLELTYTEFELLKYLAMHPGRVLTREHLLSEVWGYDYYGGTRTVDVHIRRLRAKLGSEYDGHITTVRNVGYRFSASR